VFSKQSGFDIVNEKNKSNVLICDIDIMLWRY